MTTENIENLEEAKKAYYKVKTSTVEHMKDLLHNIKWSKHDELQSKIKELESELENLKNTKKYWLVWDTEKEPEQVVLDCQKKLPILKEVKERKIINDDNWESNLLIEWDNYHALQVLNYTHKEAIDVIYIDPPYNTWNKDFIYNDKYIDKEDTYRHSKWLNFMEKRLRLAHNLLKEDWVIFISIDDNEQAQLKLLCDEIFWDENFMANIIWQHSLQPKAYDNRFSWHHNYLLWYKKTDNFKLGLLDRTEEHNKNYSNPDKDPRWFWRTWDVRSSYAHRKNLLYSITAPNGNIIQSPEKWWRWSEETMNEKINSWEVIFNKANNWIIRKIYLSDQEWRTPETIWFWKDIWTTREWQNELKEIFNGVSPFDTPKPKELLKQILKISILKKEWVILDFFAWSWTTWHAVLDLNKEDWGNRKFILCTNNENNICEEITYERIKRVSKWYTNSKWKDVDWLWWNLRYYKTEFVEVENLKEITDQKKLELTYNAWELLAIKEWIYNELEKNEYWQIFESNKDMVAVYFKESSRKIDDMKNRLIEIQKQKWWKVKWYIYNNPYEKTMFKDIKKLELKDIPDPILKVYREINKV